MNQDIHYSSQRNSRDLLIRFSAAAGILLIAGILFVSDHGMIPNAGIGNDSQQVAAANGTTTVPDQSEEVHAGDPFKTLNLKAQSAYVYDIAEDEMLFAKDPNARLPLASITKLMTALVASEEIPPSATITISAEDISMDGDTGLLVGEKWRLSDLIDYTLITSSNDGASALATGAGSQGQVAYDMSREAAKENFINHMNQTAQELGLRHTYFLNETGLDVSTSTSGAYGTAREVGELMQYLVETHPSLVERTRDVEFRITSLQGVSHAATNTNINADRLSGLIASKTGYTDLAGGNLVVAFDVGIGHPVVAVVLGSTYEGRFSDMRRIVEATKQAHTQERISKQRAE